MARKTAFSRYQLQGVREKNYEIGRGSYAVVEELDYHGLTCVGKSIHRQLYDNATVRVQEEMLERFAVECELLSQIRHPHIVQFLGVYFKEAAQGRRSAPLPVIVMERLHCTLASTIERHGRLTEEISHPILREVATGLAYLHACPVVHRDLSANNILLATNMSAKISDLGVAKILDLSPARMVQMTTCPGTPSYMPPEALATGQAIFSTKIDIFSYGNLMTHVLSGEWPIPTEVFRFEASNPGVPIPITEAERREKYLYTIGEDHALMPLIRQCLSNNPAVRPDAPEILRSLDERTPQHPLLFTDRVEALQRITENQEQVRQHQQMVEEKEQEVKEKQRELAEKQEEVQAKKEEVGQLQGEVEDVRREKEERLQEKEEQLQEKGRQVEQKQQLIDQLVSTHRVKMGRTQIYISELAGECQGLKVRVRAKQEEVEATEAMARAREREATAKEEQLAAVKQELAAKEELLETKEGELWTLDQQLGLKNQELTAKDQELSSKDNQLAAKEAEVASKKQEVVSVRQELTVRDRELAATREKLAGMRSDRDAQKEAIAARDSQLRAKDQELASKEIVLATKESTIAQLRSQASMSLLLSPQFKIRWRRCADMPGPMAHPHLVRINTQLYAAGGNCGTHAYNMISRYNPAGDTWSTLPECPTIALGLTELEETLVLVGGFKIGPISNVYTLEDSGKWRKSLPPLLTARVYLTAFRYKSFLIACGGVTSWTDNKHYTCTTAVEVFSSETSQWYNAEPLPDTLHAMSYAIINDTCYLIGGASARGMTNRAFCASLPSLIQQATAQANPQSPTASQSSSSPPSAIWRALPRCPCYASTAAGLGGCLLAIGGLLPESTTGSTLVHLYSPGTNSWVRLSNADIPEPRYHAAAAQLANGNIILVGGKVNPDELCNTAFVGSIEF